MTERRLRVRNFLWILIHLIAHNPGLAEEQHFEYVLESATNQLMNQLELDEGRKLKEKGGSSDGKTPDA